MEVIVMAVPFSNKVFMFKNPDGSEIQVRGWGNQYYARFETMDGFTVVKNPDTGYYQYAKLSEDKNRLLATGVNVGEADPRSLELPQHIRIRREAVKKQAQKAHDADGTPGRWEVRRAKRKKSGK